MIRARNTVRLPAIAVMGAALALAACAQERGTYMKSGGTNVSNDELAQTKERCHSASSAFGFTFGDTNLGRNRPPLPGRIGTRNTVTRQEADLYRLCMNDRGYGQVTAEKAKTPESE
jgi:hypothetical protein